MSRIENTGTLSAPSQELLEAIEEACATVHARAIDRLAAAHDASHYLLTPKLVAWPRDAAEVGRILAASRRQRASVTFRSVKQFYHYRKSRGRLRSDIDFRSWVRATLLDNDEDLKGWSTMFLGQLDRISSASGEVLVDDIYRFESFEEDFARLCRRVGVNVALPHKKPSTHRHFSEYYDAATADIVGEAFQRDVELFGYTLDQP